MINRDYANYLLVGCLLFATNFRTFSQNLQTTAVTHDLIFGEENGIISVEAEFFYKQSNNSSRNWYVISEKEKVDVGQEEDTLPRQGSGNNTYLKVLPDTRVTHEDKLVRGENFSNIPGQIAVLHYKINIEVPGRYYVWVRAFSAGSEDNSIHVGIDGNWPDSGKRMQWCEGKRSWRWESKQRTDSVHCGIPHLIFLYVEETGIHDIQFSMREDGFEFDRFLLTRDKDYVPQGKGPSVTLSDRDR